MTHPAIIMLQVIRDALAENQIDAAEALQAELDKEWCDCIVYTMDAFKAEHYGMGGRRGQPRLQTLPIPHDVQQARRDRMEAKVRRSALPNQLRLVVDPAMPRDRIMLVNGDIASGRLVIFRDNGTFVID